MILVYRFCYTRRLKFPNVSEGENHALEFPFCLVLAVLIEFINEDHFSYNLVLKNSNKCNNDDASYTF